MTVLFIYLFFFFFFPPYCCFQSKCFSRDSKTVCSFSDTCGDRKRSLANRIPVNIPEQNIEPGEWAWVFPFDQCTLTGIGGGVDSFILACFPFWTERCFCFVVFVVFFSKLERAMLRTLPEGCRTGLLHFWLLQIVISAIGNAHHSLDG